MGPTRGESFFDLAGAAFGSAGSFLGGGSRRGSFGGFEFEFSNGVREKFGKLVGGDGRSSGGCRGRSGFGGCGFSRAHRPDFFAEGGGVRNVGEDLFPFGQSFVHAARQVKRFALCQGFAHALCPADVFFTSRRTGRGAGAHLDGLELHFFGGRRQELRKLRGGYRGGGRDRSGLPGRLGGGFSRAHRPDLFAEGGAVRNVGKDLFPFA